jgi:DNA polymerase (family X)
MISINPDAHHKEGFNDMYYGVCAARKGMLPGEMCLNALPLEELLKAFKKNNLSTNTN